MISALCSPCFALSAMRYALGTKSQGTNVPHYALRIDNKRELAVKLIIMEI
jgi:hypothetical protein